MANPNPVPPPPRKPSATHASRQITVRVPIDVAEIIDTVRAEAETTTEATLTLGRWLMLGMETERQFEEAMKRQD